MFSLTSISLGTVRCVLYVKVHMDSNQNSSLYVKALMEERQQTLQELEEQHRQGLLPLCEYMTCRMALLRALEELQKVLRGIEEAELPPLGV